MTTQQSRIMQKVQFPAGSILFSQGETSREIYILNKGIIEVLTGNNIVAQISQRGVFFGEMAAILKEARNATLRAQTDCDCIVLYEKYMDTIIRTTPEIGLSLVRILAQRLKKTTNKLSAMLERDSNAINRFKNPYQVMLALEMISTEHFERAVTAMRGEHASRPFIYYLKQAAQVDKADIMTVINLFKKYHS
ncbi:hypothetical protein COTS27_00185 [Spirochaetota bacterium]|nr:hypothetical protein COTS27_00185 [Spirochaetota bacterium]